MTKVFFAKTRTLTGEEFEKAFAAADGERQKKVLMKKSPDGRISSLFGGLLLTAACKGRAFLRRFALINGASPF